MRHLERSHGVCISWMHEMFTRDCVCLEYEVTDRMAADIYTKAFNANGNMRVCRLVYSTRACCLTRRSHLRVIP